jgi:cysteinyl-tRNA synthetase
MSMLRIYNTLTRKVEDFQPINAQDVRIYACGPTVYDYQHIGHMRRYIGDDVLTRTLRFDGYKVKYVMNITDVGHLVSDADDGQDKMEKGAEKYGASVLDIAKKFEDQFLESIKLLNIQMPDAFLKASKHIQEQVELIQILEEKGFTYKTSDGVYFDTSKFKNYNKLSKQPLEKIKAGARVSLGEKKNPTDFALWKLSPSLSLGKKRQMEWESPWGVGFPGWHIECSAMSMKALGVTFDIHTGGIDHINIHHTNEIAQSEAASGKKFVNYWVHHNFLLVEGEKMSKSLDNFYTVGGLARRGYDPLALRYLVLQTHYRQEMNFTFGALKAAQNALNKLRLDFLSLKEGGVDKKNAEKYANVFFETINNDLNTPKALAIIWEMLKTDLSSGTKRKLLLDFDQILGLDLENAEKYQKKVESISEEILKLVAEREKLRKERHFHLADKIRARIQELGYDVEDRKEGSNIILLDKL